MYEGLKSFLVDIEEKNSNEMMQELESLEVLIEKSSLCKADTCNRQYRHYKDGSNVQIATRMIQIGIKQMDTKGTLKNVWQKRNMTNSNLMA